MAYKASDLSVLAYANGFTLWHYKTSDNAAAVKADGYFNDAHEILRRDDVILHTSGALLRVSAKASNPLASKAIEVKTPS
ncbi:MAG: hypothetical protein GDA54_01665 [Alphaproteobacteria bacterium GM7ARS4]|nr:hypothetical protein [Alphaproteobacteria bacterium GM7ARS4]